MFAADNTTNVPALHREQGASALSEDERLRRTVACDHEEIGRVCGAGIGQPCVNVSTRLLPPSARHLANRLEAAKRAQARPIKLGDLDAIERTRAAVGETYVPEPGERVRIDAVKFPEAHGHFVGTILKASPGCRAGSIQHEEWLAFFSAEAGHAHLGIWCRVSPLPSGPIDVECDICKAKPGDRCRTGRPDGIHTTRQAAFLALTGGKDSGRAAGAQAADDAGSQDTGRTSSPAAPSGFKLCPGLVDVGGLKCGAQIQTLTGELCGDCLASVAGERQRIHRRAVGILRADLDRPLPKRVAEAERIWPAGAGEDYEL